MLVHRLVGFTYSVVKHYNFKCSQESRKDNPKVNKNVHVDWYSNSFFVRKKEMCVCMCSVVSL